MKTATHFLPLVAASAICASLTCSAEDFRLADGREIKGATVSRAEPDGLVVMTDAGIEKIPFHLLPAEIQKQHGYDAQRAAQYAAQVARAQEERGQRTQQLLVQEAARQKAEAQSAPTTTAKVVAKPATGLLIRPGALTISALVESPFSLRGYAVEVIGIGKVEKQEVAEGVYGVRLWASDFSGSLTAKLTAAQLDSIVRGQKLYAKIADQEEYSSSVPVEVLGSGVTYQGLERAPTFIWR